MLVAIVASGGALALATSPASASIITPPPPGAHGQYGGGASADFSYGPAPFYTQMGRNLVIEAPGFVPGTSVSTAWRDGTASTAWTNGPSIAASNPTGTITSMPRSTCGHAIQVRFTGGVSDVNNGTWTTVPYTEFATTSENCGPMVWLTSTGIAGDGFTPSGQVRVQTFDRYGVTLSTQTTTATPSSVTRCGPVGLFPNCFTFHLTTGGQIDVANALNTGTPCQLLPQSYTGTDLATGEYDKNSGVCFQ
ncbi:MAG TPA: hypothetical protein VJ741_16660 [Solirubrobacteraceae bacterium]|nr:hypothetical protein [Solirubrobacteraceae bacterium]